MGDTNEAEIYKGVHWVGIKDQSLKINNNPYLIVDGEQVVLIDPGTAFEFTSVYRNICKHVSIGQITHVILHNQSHASSAAIPLLLEKGLRATIVLHERAESLYQTYREAFEFFLVSAKQNKLALQSGREIYFLEAPYLQYYESMMSYDSRSRILFSSELFSATPRKWTLFADRVFYKESMKSYHERFIPSNEALQPVLSLVEKLDLYMIAPHHGSVITERLQRYIDILKDLECGIFVNPIKYDITRKEGYIQLCNLVVKELVKHFTRGEVAELFHNTELETSEKTGLIVAYPGTGEELWEKLFSLMVVRKGMLWLSVIRDEAFRLVRKYNTAAPKVLNELNTQLIDLDIENVRLKEQASGFEKTKRNLTTCPITQLHNEPFMRNFMVQWINDHLGANEDFALMLIDIDKIANIRLNYGEQGKDIKEKTLKAMAYHLEQFREQEQILFKMMDDSFACLMPRTDKDTAMDLAEKFRNIIEKSDRFYQKITVSIGLSNLGEFPIGQRHVDYLIEETRNRVVKAKTDGMNLVCGSFVQHPRADKRKILIADDDKQNLEVLIVTFIGLGYEVVSCTDGDMALSLLESQKPDLVISELMLPKHNGFVIRENMLALSAQKNVPFILLSHLKDEESTKHAAILKIQYYFRKPIMLTELMGMVDNLIQD